MMRAHERDLMRAHVLHGSSSAILRICPKKRKWCCPALQC